MVCFVFDARMVSKVTITFANMGCLCIYGIAGLQVVDHYGNCHMSTYTDMDLAGIDQDKAMAAVLKHDSKLDVNRNVCFQMALLYTTKAGQRRVRVHNLSLPVSGQIAEVFRSGDEDTTVSILLRKGKGPRAMIFVFNNG